MFRIVLFCISVFFCTIETFAQIKFSSLYPNPPGDESIWEYIEVGNTSCGEQDISWFSITDASGKSYLIEPWVLLAWKETIKFFSSTTKISLNNSPPESLTLKNPWGYIVDSVNYMTNQGEGKILEFDFIHENCIGEMTHTWITWSWREDPLAIENMSNAPWSSLSGSWILYEEGIVGDSSSWSVLNGNHSSWSAILIWSGQHIPWGTWGEVSYDNSTPLSWIIQPMHLFHGEEDWDGYIDFLIIEYDETLTGVVHTWAISISFMSGWTVLDSFDSWSVLVHTWFLSGSFLYLMIENWYLLWNISGSLGSIRLWSHSALWFSSLTGREPESFSQEHSFEEYENVSLWHDGNLHEILSESGALWWEQIHSPNIISQFPEIFPTLQSPTNAQFQSWAFLCTVETCRINVTFVPAFQSGFLLKDYTCFFKIGNNPFFEESDCNPNTLSFESASSIGLEIAARASSGSIRIEYPVVFLWEWEDSAEEAHPKDNGIPVAIIDLDTSWKEYFERIGTNELNCYVSPCSLNFTAERSYDPDWNQLKYHWILDTHTTKSSKDPWAIKYGTWDHHIRLEVIDEYGNSDRAYYTVHVLGPKSHSWVHLWEQAWEHSQKQIVASQKSKEKRKFQKLQMEFFTEPEIILQGKTGVKQSDRTYRCSVASAKTCSMNFALSWSLESFDYIWLLDGKKVFQGKNPPSWKIALGIHSLRVVSVRKWESLPVSSFDITMRIDKAQKVPKKSPTPKSKPTSSLKVIPETHAATFVNGNWSNTDAHLAFITLIFGVWFGFYLKSRKDQNHSSL